MQFATREKYMKNKEKQRKQEIVRIILIFNEKSVDFETAVC